MILSDNKQLHRRRKRKGSTSESKENIPDRGSGKGIRNQKLGVKKGKVPVVPKKSKEIAVDRRTKFGGGQIANTTSDEGANKRRSSSFDIQKNLD